MSSSKPVMPLPPPPVVDTHVNDVKYTSHSAKAVKTSKRWFEATPCEGPGCKNTVPGGFYSGARRRFFCSFTCKSRSQSQHEIGTCPHCGGPILGKKSEAGKKQYCSQVHRWAFETEHILGPTGSFRKDIEEYMVNGAASYYKGSTLYSVRSNLAKFFRFAAQEEGLSALEEIRPSTVTRFIAKEQARGVNTRNYVGHLATFFNHRIAEERYLLPNPVVSRIHSQAATPLMPRPYKDDALQTIWHAVELSGTLELMLAFAVGHECGLRIGEVCNIRLSDIDQSAQTIFVRLPTKNGRTRTVPYHDKVKKYLELWLRERDPQCPSDHLLHNTARSYFTTGLLDYWFKKLLSKEPEPAASFEFHRLRHTWATRLMNNGMELAVLKVLGGWESWKSMQGYIHVLDSTVRAQYAASYAKIQEKKQEEEGEILSLLDFAALNPDLTSVVASPINA